MSKLSDVLKMSEMTKNVILCQKCQNVSKIINKIQKVSTKSENVQNVSNNVKREA